MKQLFGFNEYSFISTHCSTGASTPVPVHRQFATIPQAFSMDQFQVIADLGNGSFGSVFKAKHVISGKEVLLLIVIRNLRV